MSPVETQFHVPLFPPFPSADRYVRVGSQDEALQRVRHAVEAWEAISLVIGPPGVGKSTICQMLRKIFSRQREVIVFGDATLESPTALQRHLLSRLDRIRGISPTPPTAGDDPQLTIMERIANSSKEFAGLLLLVDEAQTLSPEVLETIRILTNCISDGRPRVSAVLLGGPRLDETLSLPSMEALVQRVATRCYLHPLSSDETVHYVSEILNAAVEGGKVSIEEAAVRAIHRACSGVPRLVNQLMTSAIETALKRNQPTITSHTVDHAWAVLQQLPSPMVEEPQWQQPASNVEFGPLKDFDALSESATGEADELPPLFETGFEEAAADFERVAMSYSDEANDRECAASCGDCGTTCASQATADQDEEADTPLAEELMMQTQLGLACDSEVDLDLLTIDCQTIGSFDDVDPAEFEQAPEERPVDATTERPAEPASAQAQHRSVPSINELFGDFDEEESIGVASTQPISPNPVNDKPEVSTFAPAAHSVEEPEEDLESSLHREILSLRGTASKPVVWTDRDEDKEPNDIRINHDDRDMLIIEDDVDVDPGLLVNEAPMDERPATTVAVDFQSMLAKMRTAQR